MSRILRTAGSISAFTLISRITGLIRDRMMAQTIGANWVGDTFLLAWTLPNLMRHWREREFERHLTPPTMRRNLGLWAWFARRPALYRLATRGAIGALSLLARGRGGFTRLPFSGNWTKGRDLPAPEPGGTFMARYAKMQRDGAIR